MHCIGPMGSASTGSARARWRRWGFQLPHQGGPPPVHRDPASTTPPHPTTPPQHQFTNTPHTHTHPTQSRKSRVAHQPAPHFEPHPTLVQTTLHNEISHLDKDCWYGAPHFIKDSASIRLAGGNINGIPAFVPNEKEQALDNFLIKCKVDATCLQEINLNLSQIPTKANLYARCRRSKAGPSKWVAACNTNTTN